MEGDILKEQIAYYRARAGEYDESLVKFHRAVSGESQETDKEPDVIEKGASLLRQMGPFEQVLELACGTGIWTNIHHRKGVLRCDHVTGKAEASGV